MAKRRDRVEQFGHSGDPLTQAKAFFAALRFEKALIEPPVDESIEVHRPCLRSGALSAQPEKARAEDRRWTAYARVLWPASGWVSETGLIGG
ncbi:hypothetical protein GCM10023196_086140 [Actinoallomurus vinaceus]|uniref:Uncharacterized protein n=1 Tax=Actinoallomurus vinaceus TaxID=1080074 RepID=A0ABP8URJ7_9ACTN